MKRLLAVAVIPFLTLSACGSDVKKTLGMERNSPDEFSVVERAPLTMPPNFNLAPPTPGAVRPVDTQSEVAKGLVLGSQSSAPTTAVRGASAAENALLQKAGTVDPTIRKKLAEPMPEKANTVAEKLGMVSPENQGKAINPTKEAQRLKGENVKTTPVVPKTQTKAK